MSLRNAINGTEDDLKDQENSQKYSLIQKWWCTVFMQRLQADLINVYQE